VIHLFLSLNSQALDLLFQITLFTWTNTEQSNKQVTTDIKVIKQRELNMVTMIKLKSGPIGIRIDLKVQRNLNHFKGLIPIVKVKYLTPRET
jgi:hypothetical protein